MSGKARQCYRFNIIEHYARLPAPSPPIFPAWTGGESYAFFCGMFSYVATSHSVGRTFCALLLRIRDFGWGWGWLARSRRMTATLVAQVALLGVGGRNRIVLRFLGKLNSFRLHCVNQVP